MEIIYLLIPLSIILILIIAWSFLWSVKSGQFDDLEGQGHRLLFDDDTVESNLPINKTKSENSHSRRSGP
jgi:cbb3-type cytochrome oxidase maturation protein